MADDTGRYSLVDVERLREEESIPPPAQTPRASLAVERMKAWGPLLGGGAAIVTAVSTFAVSAGGWFRQDLSPITGRLDRIEARLDRIDTDHRRTQEQLDRHERDSEAKESNERATAELIEALRKELRQQRAP